MAAFKLSKEYGFEEKKYQVLNLSFEDLTGNDMIVAEKEARLLDPEMRVPELSKTYLAVVGAKAANVPVDFVLKLNAKDFSAFTLEVQNFLLG